MALRSSRKFVLNIAYQPPPLCLSLSRIFAGKRLYSSSSRILQYNRPCVQAVINCYQKKEQFLHYKDSVVDTDQASVEEKKGDGDIYHLVLTAQPHEFHKLPPKCSACGAILQTKHDKQIGYINKTKFVDSLKRGILDKLSCFNCYRLRYHNSPVIGGVNSNDAMDQLRHIRQRTALILYVVDLFDIEGTMLQNILELVGKNKRMLIVGNKIDRFPQDDEKPHRQMEAMKGALRDICFQNGLENCNLRDVCLISAETGFGLISLLKKIMKHREDFMDVYLVGCTNTGKSTLYNLLVNMLNVHKSSDLPAQAIVHHLPGTTSSLVRESISRLQLEKMDKRLKLGLWEVEEAYDFDDELLNLLGVKKDNEKYKAMGMAVDTANKKEQRRQKLLGQKMNMMEPRPLEFVDEKSRGTEEQGIFLYDTPGILNNSQIVQYLTSSEINYLSPSQWVVPRTFILKPGNCLFVGGLARLDYISIKRSPLEGKEDISKHYDDVDVDDDDNCDVDDSLSEEVLPSGQSIYVTAMVSPNVPIHVTYNIETADEKFEKLFSDNFLELPKGTPERFKEFPKLKECQYTIVGKTRNINACDLVLHGVGWLSIAALLESRVGLALHTPNGQGQGLRLNPLLPLTVQKKIGRGVRYHGHRSRYMYGHSRKRSRQLIWPLQEKDDPIRLWQLKVKKKMKQARFQKKENERLERIEQGIVLGKMKNIKEKEEKLRLREEQNYAKLLEEAK